MVNNRTSFCCFKRYLDFFTDMVGRENVTTVILFMTSCIVLNNSSFSKITSYSSFHIIIFLLSALLPNKLNQYFILSPSDLFSKPFSSGFRKNATYLLGMYYLIFYNTFDLWVVDSFTCKLLSVFTHDLRSAKCAHIY